MKEIDSHEQTLGYGHEFISLHWTLREPPFFPESHPTASPTSKAFHTLTHEQGLPHCQRVSFLSSPSPAFFSCRGQLELGKSKDLCLPSSSMSLLKLFPFLCFGPLTCPHMNDSLTTPKLPWESIFSLLCMSLTSAPLGQHLTPNACY